ncbi:MAG: hypothetical protein TECD_00307 [Hyphomicrobiaceae bacterium hypho_1]
MIRSVCSVSIIACFIILLSAKAKLRASNWPTEIVARYDISFAGFQVGSFDFRSSANSDRYSLVGEANVSAVFGAFKWTGSTYSYGRAEQERPDPVSYIFDYRSNINNGSVRLDFMKGHIIRSDVSPYQPHTDQHIPLHRKHMRDVYDPISAVMALTRSVTGHPCQQRIPIFDGKQRFDLVFIPGGRKKISEERPSGQPNLAHVCKIQYVPIAGYEPNSHIYYMMNNQDMRITLREVPSANLLAPYEVRIPTIAGEVVLSARIINIITAQRQRIALIH